VGKISVTVEPSVEVVVRPDGSIIVASVAWRSRSVTEHIELDAIRQKIGAARLTDALAKTGHLDEVDGDPVYPEAKR
jgi:hypothetical protein